MGSVYGKFADANMDGQINSLDVDDIIRALGDNAAWEARHPGFDILEYLDGNVDGKVNNLDISSYIGAFVGPSFFPASANSSQVPEPPTSALALFAIAALGLLSATNGLTARPAVKL